MFIVALRCVALRCVALRCVVLCCVVLKNEVIANLFFLKVDVLSLQERSSNKQNLSLYIFSNLEVLPH